MLRGRHSKIFEMGSHRTSRIGFRFLQIMFLGIRTLILLPKRDSRWQKIQTKGVETILFHFFRHFTAARLLKSFNYCLLYDGSRICQMCTRFEMENQFMRAHITSGFLQNDYRHQRLDYKNLLSLSVTADIDFISRHYRYITSKVIPSFISYFRVNSFDNIDPPFFSFQPRLVFFLIFKSIIFSVTSFV